MRTQEDILELLKKENQKWNEFNQIVKEIPYISMSEELQRYYNASYERKVILEWVLEIR
jgi:hypothetical protein